MYQAKLSLLKLLCLPAIALGHESWIMACAKQGIHQDWLDDQPVEGSVSHDLVTCMVNHVISSPYTPEELQLVPSSEAWCLPADFLSEQRTCASLHFDVFAPIRYCIEEEGFPELSSSAQYAQGFQDGDSSRYQSSFYLSSRLSNAMCAHFDGLHSQAGRGCLVELCRHASHAPSQAPSLYPSNLPSLAPSQTPSIGPSRQPSRSPSTAPSEKPSLSPTLQPSSEPSIQPTKVATEHPSSHPTTEETQLPSALPTMQPSWYPTPSPSLPSTMGPGQYLQIRITLRVLLDGVETLEVPFSNDAITAFERALGDTVRALQGFQNVEIGSATRAPLPDNAPVLLVFRISALRRCHNEQCRDPFAATSIAREFRSAFEKGVQSGQLQKTLRRQASRQGLTGLFEISPRPNSSNLMSSNSLLITSDTENNESSGVELWFLVGWMHYALLSSILFSLFA